MGPEKPVGTENQKTNGYRGPEEQWVHRISEKWAQRTRGAEGTEN